MTDATCNRIQFRYRMIAALYDGLVEEIGKLIELEPEHVESLKAKAATHAANAAECRDVVAGMEEAIA